MVRPVEERLYIPPRAAAGLERRRTVVVVTTSSSTIHHVQHKCGAARTIDDRDLFVFVLELLVGEGGGREGGGGGGGAQGVGSRRGAL